MKIHRLPNYNIYTSQSRCRIDKVKKQQDKDIFNAAYTDDKSVSFCSFRRVGLDRSKLLDTSFFRGVSTLKVAIKHIADSFGSGATVFDAATSCGQEAWSIAMLSGGRYKIIGLDPDKDAINIARQGVHSVYSSAEDAFLIEEDLSKLTEEQIKLRQLFHHFFVETEEPKEPLNNSMQFLRSSFQHNFKLIHFRLRNNLAGLVDFREASEGDIFRINAVEPGKKVSAIFFRNAFYHLTDNRSPAEIIEDLFIEDLEAHKVNTAVLGQIVDKIHSKLDNDGIFVVGDIGKEHLYPASKKLSVDSGIRLADTSVYKKFASSIGPVYFTQKNLDRAGNLTFSKVSPLQEALEKGGRFVPIHYDPLFNMPEIEVPTIWQKVQ